MKTKKFNVIDYDSSSKKFVSYDVIPIFIEKYNEIKRGRPITFDDFKEMILSESFRQFYGRHEFEFDIVKSQTCRTIDIDWQIRNNLDLITEMVMEQVKNK